MRGFARKVGHQSAATRKQPRCSDELNAGASAEITIIKVPIQLLSLIVNLQKLVDKLAMVETLSMARKVCGYDR